MKIYLSYRNTFAIFSCLWLSVSFSVLTASAPQRYPYVLPKCCEPKEYEIGDGNSMSSDERSIVECGAKGSEVIFLPKTIFPEMSNDVEDVEVKLLNSVTELKCDEGQDYLDISIDLIDNESSKTVNVSGNEDFVKVAFSGDNLLTADGNIYNRRHFCVSSRTKNTTHLAIKTCKQTCSTRNPCIPRCCRGHQSFLTSLPTPQKESFQDFCSIPTLENSWSPWTSSILRVHNRTRFYQSRYIPHIRGDRRTWDPVKECNLLHVKLEEAFTLILLEDGRLQLKRGNKTGVLDNFCLDGVYEGIGENSRGDIRETLEEKETVVVYDCTQYSLEESYASLENIITVPACSYVTYPSGQLLQLPRSLFPNRIFETKETVEVTLATRKDGGRVECFVEYDHNWDFKGSMDTYFDVDGGLVIRGIHYDPSEFCIRGVTWTTKDLSCDVEWKWLSAIILMLGLPVSVLFHLSIAVVYTLRKDKEPVLRSSIVAFSISMILTYVLSLTHKSYFNSDSFTTSEIITLFTYFFRTYGFSWMSVLCFDVWLNITFLRPGRRSGKRLWGYIAFTYALSIVFFGVYIFAAPEVFLGSVYGLMVLNFLFFLATAVKLWIAQHSSGIINQRKTFLMYFKLFLLIGFRCIIDFLFFLSLHTKSRVLKPVAFLLLSLHPMVLFFLLVWDEETQRYLETNYPRVKRALDVISGIGYPVRKCWGLCRRCKLPRDKGTSGNGAIEPPHNSAHMYVHTRRVPNIRN